MENENRQSKQKSRKNISTILDGAWFSKDLCQLTNLEWCADHVILEVLKLASNIKIFVEFWIFVFFLIFSWKKSYLKEVKISLIEIWSFISFELRQHNSLKVPKNAKFSHSIFGWKSKENKDSKFDKNFNIRRQFQHFE